MYMLVIFAFVAMYPQVDGAPVDPRELGIGMMYSELADCREAELIFQGNAFKTQVHHGDFKVGYVSDCVRVD